MKKMLALLLTVSCVSAVHANFMSRNNSMNEDEGSTQMYKRHQAEKQDLQQKHAKEKKKLAEKHAREMKQKNMN